MAFSKVKVGGLADDSVTAANIDDDGTGYTVGNLTNSGTLQQTGQVTLGTGGNNWTLPTSRGANDKYVLQINGTTGAADWAESLTAPEISGHNFDVSGSTDDGGINQYEAPYEYTGTTNATTTISALSSTTGLLAGQYISGAGIPADTTIVSVNSGASTMVISNAVTVAGTQTGVALKIQKTPGEKNGGKVTLTGANFGATIGEITVAITNSAGAVIANASYLSGLSNGTSVTAEWTGTEGTYSTDLTSSYTGSIYFKMTKSGLSSNVHNTNATLTSDPAVTALSSSSQTGGDVFTDPSATSLGAYGFGRTAGGGQDSNTKVLLNFDRGGGTDFEDSSNIGGDGHKVTASGNAVIKASPFGDGKSAMFFDGTGDYLTIAQSSATNADFNFGTSTDYTIEGWYKATTRTQNYAGIIGTYSASTAGYSLGLVHHNYTTDGATQFSLCLTTNNFTNALLSGGSVSARFEEWIHFALVRSGSTTSMYINGKLADSTTTSINMASSSGMRIGSNGTDNTSDVMYGYLDEIRIVKGTAVYTEDFDVPTSRLTAITNTKLLIHSELGDGGVFLGKAVKKTMTVTKSTGTVFGTNNDAQTLVSGSYSHSENFHFTTSNPSNNGYFEFVCDNDKSIVINGFHWYQNQTNTHGTWQLKASNNTDFSSPVTLISSLTLGGTNGRTTYTTDSANTTAYKRFRLEKTSGSVSNNPYCEELEFFNNTITDSSSSSHTITPTGSEHSQGHKGIAPVLTWPASLKKTGSSGVYFDGDGDYLTISSGPNFSGGAYTYEWWMYPQANPTNSMLIDTRDSSNTGNIRIWADANGSGMQLIVYYSAATYLQFNSIVIPLDQWTHVALASDGTDMRCYINGKYGGKGTKPSSDNGGGGDILISRVYTGSQYYYNGYIDGFRIRSGAISTSENTSNWSNGYSEPTKVYGAYGLSNPDVGTITLTATGDGDFTWSEVAGGTALPGTLAVSSTTHSGSGNSRTHTATITGTLPVNTSTTYTNGLRSDLATNNILLKVQHDTDATKAVTLNGTTGMGITQKTSERPVLFNARRYMGNGTRRDINGLGFKPDFVWIKNRDLAQNHILSDSVRGATKSIFSNVSNQEETHAQRVLSFNSDGVTIGTKNDNNEADDGIIAWAWKAGGAPTATNDNTSGAMDANSVSVNDTLQSSYTPSGSPSIYPKKMSVNTAGGFSIIQYAKNATAGATVPHGLSQAPEMIIVKDLGADNNWMVYHKYSGNGNTHDSEDYYLSLDQTIAATDSDTRWNDTVPSSSVVTLGGSGHVNGPGGPDYIMYCWHSVTGVSKFGTYQGNSTTQTITTGFKPRFVMIKSNTASGSWSMWDTFRTASGNLKEVYANGNSVEPASASSTFTLTSENDGFRFTNQSHVSLNNSSHHYVYMAFA